MAKFTAWTLCVVGVVFILVSAAQVQASETQCTAVTSVVDKQGFEEKLTQKKMSCSACAELSYQMSGVGMETKTGDIRVTCYEPAVTVTIKRKVSFP